MKNRYLIALVAALGLVPVVLDGTIVNIALTPIREALNSDVNTVQWIISGYFLANAATVVVGGYLANRFGRKLLFVTGIVLFTIGSVLCGIAPSIGWLIALRVVQGIGGGLLLPIGAAMAFEAFPQNERARASAVVGIPILLAPIFGPILGGYLTDKFDWHSIFFVNLPVGIIAAIAAIFVLPADRPSTANASRFDFIGLTLSTLGVISVIYSINLVTQKNPSTVTATNPAGDLYGFGYWLVWVLLGSGIVLLGMFAFYSLRLSRDPALDLRQFGRRSYLVASLISWTASLTSLGLLLLFPLYLESVRVPHLSALDTGLALVPFGIGTILGTILSTALYRLLGPRIVVAIGAALAGLSSWVLTQIIHPTADAGQIVSAMLTQSTVPTVAGPDELRWGLLLVGLSFTFIAFPVQTLALEALTGDALTKASSLYLSTRLLFGSVGAAIITTVLVDRTHTHASDLVNQAQTLIGQSGDQPGAAAQQLFASQVTIQSGTWAIQGIFLIIGIGSICLLVLSMLLPGRARQASAAQGDTAVTVDSEAMMPSV